jgi:prephenate dehydratase/prephenate dehydrogenase
MRMKKTTIGITGFGRFGQVLHDLFKDGFKLLVSSSTYKQGDFEGVEFAPLEEVIKRSDAIFLTVPINKMDPMAKRVKPYLAKGQIVIDVCSIKEYSFGALKDNLKGTGVHIWPTHPMFGPDSSKDGFQGLRWVSCEEEISPAIIAPYVDYLEEKGLKIVRVSCSKHDQLAAKTQGLTHLVGRVLKELGVERTQIDTIGFEKLMEVKEQTCNDTWELFCDLQLFNKYSMENERELREAILKVFASLLDSTIKRDKILIGIQGGKGSFNDEAIRFFLGREDVDKKKLFGDKPIEIEYLITSDAVLSALTKGETDYGLFALENSGSGIVIPSMEAMSRYNFQFVEIFDIPIVQCLVCHQDAKLEDLKKVFSHPQAISQCSKTLDRDYSALEKIMGSDKNDTAVTARELAEGTLGKEYAVIASETAASLCGLKIIEQGIHDDRENRTSFAFVKRRQLNEF